MANGVYIAMSAAVAASKQLAVTANNIANVNTTGYKQTRTAFDAFLVSSNDGTESEKGFTAMTLTKSDMSVGNLERTGNPLDAALTGPGFFVVRTPTQQVLTRAGSFRISVDGTLVSPQGHPVLGGDAPGSLTPVRVAPNGGPVTLGPGGEVEQDGTVLATLAVVDVDESKLSKIGDTAFSAPVNAYVHLPKPSVQQGYLERSNVNALRGMIELIEVSRDYERSAKIMSKFRRSDSQVLDVL